MTDAAAVAGRGRGVAAAPTPRPRLRGWSHVAATGPALAGAVVLVALAHGDPGRQVALLVYGAASVLLFATSGLYHVGTWSPPVRARLRRLDHANIFLLIAATYTPLTLTLLTGAWKVSVITIIWTLAVLGVALVMSPVAVPRALRAAAYVATGWVALFALPAFARSGGLATTALIAGAGVLYSIGAVLYGTRWPRLNPRWFGYHEVFHLLVIAANAMFFAVMAVAVVPHEPH